MSIIIPGICCRNSSHCFIYRTCFNSFISSLSSIIN
nr:MAG TPA: hypothetical protein [Caudoviricetes sp.]